MAKFTKEEFINGLKEMTILEVKELVDAMKEEFGVDPSSVAVSAGPAVEVEEGPSSYDLVLASAGSSKLAVIKLIKEVTGLGLKEAKDIADNGGVIKEKLSTDDAKDLKAKFEEAGATIELK